MYVHIDVCLVGVQLGLMLLVSDFLKRPQALVWLQRIRVANLQFAVEGKKGTITLRFKRIADLF